MTTFIKDLIDIPEHVQRGDFVLRLSEGVNRAEETLRDYVVTPELKACFDNALSFIRSALQVEHEQSQLSARQLRQRQEPLHGRAAPDPARQPGRTRHSRTGSGHQQAQRLDRRQEVPAGAVPHDRLRTTWSRASSAATSISSAGPTRMRRSLASIWPKACSRTPRTCANGWATSGSSPR